MSGSSRYVPADKPAATPACGPRALIKGIAIFRAAELRAADRGCLDRDSYGLQRRASADDDRIVAQALPEDDLVAPFGSFFEQRVCNRMTDRGYSVVPQYPALGYSIDLVVVGATARLAIECDGDHWHGPEAYQRDMARQRELERCGWSFFRVLESDFVRNPATALAPLWEQLTSLDIHPSGWLPPAEAQVTMT
jgi:very-short-patch-repair endonuclease